MSFWNNLRGFRRRRSASHAWIAFHRLVEAHARSTGQSFRRVFDALAKRHDFGREPAGWPTLEVMRTAAEELARTHALQLDARAARVAASRARKRLGQRAGDPADRLDAMRIAAAAHAKPKPGFWGWRAYRAQAEDGQR
ncbi:MAG: hypothetical protein JSR82_17280 [Verrucomicrobia bacterium]|nr:hypothetical protein [Verrucomicrobiota bacterium]